MRKVFEILEKSKKQSKYDIELFEGVYIDYLTNKDSIDSLPKIFKDNRIRKLETFRNLDFDFLIFLVKDKGLGEKYIKVFNDTLGFYDSGLKIVGNELCFKNEKIKKAIESPVKDLFKGITVFFLFFVIFILIFKFLDNFVLNSMMIFVLLLYEFHLIMRWESLKQNKSLKKISEELGIWRDGFN